VGYSIVVYQKPENGLTNGYMVLHDFHSLNSKHCRNWNPFVNRTTKTLARIWKGTVRGSSDRPRPLTTRIFKAPYLHHQQKNLNQILQTT